MKNLDRYTVTALWLADLLSESLRRLILRISNTSCLNEIDTLLDAFCAEAAKESKQILHTNPAAMAKIGADCRLFGFAESELSRRLGILDGDHTSKLTVITWDYAQMVTVMLQSIDRSESKLNPKLTSRIYDKAKQGFRTLVSSLIENGCYANIEGITYRYLFFGASAGQMRKKRFVLLRDDMYELHNEAMKLDLPEEDGSLVINASKYLPYKMLCMSSGRKESWFDLDKCIVVPDKTVNLTAVVDTVTPAYEVVRGERTDIENPINDGLGFYWRHDPSWQPRNIQVRFAFVKGLLTPLNFLSLFRLYGKEPVVTDLWGVSHDLVQEGIEVILTESQLKLNTAYFRSWNEYKSLCQKYRREFVVLNEDGEYVHESEIPYQAIQSLVFASDEELKSLASRSIHSLQNMMTPEGALEALKADRIGMHSSGFSRALHLLPDLLGDAYSREQLSNLYDQRYRLTNSGKLLSNGKYRYIVPDPIALFEACFLGVEPKGVLKAGEIWQRSIPSGHKVDVLRSPHMYTSEHCLRTVAPYRRAFEFMDTDAVYLSIWGLDARQLMADYDGDIALVVDDPNLVATAEHCIQDADAGVLYYDAQKAPKKPLTSQAVVEAIFNAADFNVIGIYSTYAVKLLASSNPDMKVLASLAAAGNFAIDAVKTGAAISLPRDMEKQLRKLEMPYWWKYDHQTEEHKYTDEYWDKELAQPGNGAIDRLGKAVRAAVPEKPDLHIPANPALWAMMVENPRRKTIVGAVDAFKDCARRNAAEWSEIFRKRPELREDWEAASAIAEKKLAAARQEIITAAKGDLLGAYDTITRALFKYPEETSFKRYYWSVFGDLAAEVITKNLYEESVA